MLETQLYAFESYFHDAVINMINTQKRLIKSERRQQMDNLNHDMAKLFIKTRLKA